MAQSSGQANKSKVVWEYSRTMPYQNIWPLIYLLYASSSVHSSCSSLVRIIDFNVTPNYYEPLCTMYWRVEKPSSKTKLYSKMMMNDCKVQTYLLGLWNCNICLENWLKRPQSIVMILARTKASKISCKPWMQCHTDRATVPQIFWLG